MQMATSEFYRVRIYKLSQKHTWISFPLTGSSLEHAVQNHSQTRLLRSSYIVFLRFTYFKSGHLPASHSCMMVARSERNRPIWVLPQPTSEAIVRQDWPLSSHLSTLIRCSKLKIFLFLSLAITSIYY